MPCYTGSMGGLEYIVYHNFCDCQSALYFLLKIVSQQVARIISWQSWLVFDYIVLDGWVDSVWAIEAFSVVLGLLKSVF